MALTTRSRSRALSAPPDTKTVRFTASTAAQPSVVKPVKRQSLPDAIEQWELPPRATYRPNGPVYVLGWIFSKEEWSELVNPPFDVKKEEIRFSDVRAIQEYWYNVYFEKFRYLWAPQSWRFSTPHTLIGVANNDPDEVRLLTRNKTLVKEVIKAAAESMGLPATMESKAKWYSFTTLCNGRSSVYKELNIVESDDDDDDDEDDDNDDEDDDDEDDDDAE